MSSTENNYEIEIKLQLASFPEYLKLIGFLGNLDREQHQTNCFFDTEDHKLQDAGWAFRVRVFEDAGLITVKGLPSEEKGSAVVREEIEAEVPRGTALNVVNLELDVLDLDIKPVSFIRKKFPGIRLAKLLKFTTIRQEKKYKIGDYWYPLVVDKTEFPDGSVDYELEVELPDTSHVVRVEDNLKKLFDSLDIPFEKAEESKFARALKHSRLA